MRLFFLLLLLSLASPALSKSKRQKADAQWKSRKRDCERDAALCGGLVEEERGNCVNECVSAECYGEVFGEEPLEDGEFDAER
jgi:hypothetical protein